MQDRPHRLVEIFTMTDERPSQDTLAHGPKLFQRAIAPSVLECRARFKPSHPENVEGEVENQLRSVHEHPGAPAFARQRKAPFRRSKRRLEGPQLEDSDRDVGT